MNGYALKSLKRLFADYAHENGRINREDAITTQKAIAKELHRRLETSLKLLQEASEADADQIYKQFIEH